VDTGQWWILALLLHILLYNTVHAFAAVPDISMFERIRPDIMTRWGKGNIHFEKDYEGVHPNPLLHTQYGKAAQSNDRLAYLRSHQDEEMQRRHRRKMENIINKHVALVRKWYTY